MPAQTYDALLRALSKGELAPVYYFYGPQDILKDEAVSLIVERALDPGLRDFNYDQRPAAQLDPESIFDLCTTLPMMADRRVVVIRDLEGWKRKPKARAAFLKYLERPARETIAILVQSAAEEEPDKELLRGAYAVACESLPAERARRWLLRRAGALGVVLEEAAAHHLVAVTEGDLGALASELQKLAALAEGPLSAERVGELVGVRRGETVYDWRDAVLDGEPGKAVAMIARLLDQPGVTAVRLVTLLGTSLIGIGLARSHYDRGVRGGVLQQRMFEKIRAIRLFGLPEWKAESGRWAGWAASWPAGRTRAGVRAARNADLALKSTTVSDELGILTDLVLHLTVPQAEAA
jgi:DNA polymerase-3 subunit delta